LRPTPILALNGSVIKSLQGPEADITFNKTDLIYLPMQLTDWLFVEVALQSLRQNQPLTLILTAMAGKKLPNM
jgi:hypothetical protein